MFEGEIMLLLGEVIAWKYIGLSVWFWKLNKVMKSGEKKGKEMILSGLLKFYMTIGDKYYIRGQRCTAENV